MSANFALHHSGAFLQPHGGFPARIRLCPRRQFSRFSRKAMLAGCGRRLKERSRGGHNSHRPFSTRRANAYTWYRGLQAESKVPGYETTVPPNPFLNRVMPAQG